MTPLPLSVALTIPAPPPPPSRFAMGGGAQERPGPALASLAYRFGAALPNAPQPAPKSEAALYLH
eukprot:4704767-Pyramimonas_sp.AAC.1